MKKVLVVLFIFTCMCNLHSSSQELNVKVTPIAFARNMWITLHGEYALPTKNKLTVGLGISPNIIPKIPLLGMDGTDMILEKSKAGISIDPEIRMYADDVMDGFFFGLYSSQRFSKSHFEDNTTEYIDSFTSNDVTYSWTMRARVGVYGAQLGWEKLLGKRDRFVVDAYLGLGLKFVSYKIIEGEADLQDFNTGGIATRGNVSLGYVIK